jgi:hypothetical protein
MTSVWMVNQLTLIAEKRQHGLNLQTARYNPRPAGVIREGSATAAVLVFMQSRGGMFMTHSQIVKGTGRSAKSVDWALLFLRSQGLVECVPDAARNPRYLRYRCLQKAGAHTTRVEAPL